MIRVAFTLIERQKWSGGYNYLLNLVRALVEYSSDRIQPVMFFGEDIREDDLTPFQATPGLEIIKDTGFNAEYKSQRLLQAILIGSDLRAARLFADHRINLVLENAQFYGWRFPIPALAWMPDFQHRHLPHLFTKYGYYRREIGFLMQIRGGRTILLSSESARKDFERFYRPSTKDRIHVARFAFPLKQSPSLDEARAIADSHGLPADYFYLPNQYYRHKNHVTVLRALALLRERGIEITVVCSGKQEDPRDASFYPELESHIRELDVSQNFRQLGLIPHSHIPALMRASVAMLNPSKFEGWSTTVEEAKATGTPMLLSDIAVHREQADGIASFFPQEDYAFLANLLEGFQSVSEAERDHRASDALETNNMKMATFVSQFTAACEQSVRRD